MSNRFDDANRADSTTTLGTPSDAGSAWVIDSGGGTWGISSNKIYSSTLGTGSRSYASLETSSNIGEAKMTLGDALTGQGIGLRYTDINNFIVANVNSGNITVFSRVAGSFGSALATYTYTAVSGDVISISADASNLITVKVNGTSAGTPITVTSNTTGTKIVLRTLDTNNRFDNITFTDASSGGAAALAGNAADVVTATGTFAGGAAALAGNASDTATATGSLLGIITCTDQTNHKIFQRSGTTKAITFSGAYPGVAGASVEVQLYASDGTTVLSTWAALTSATISAGTWSGTLNTPQGGMYRFAARFKDAGAVVIAQSVVSTNLWGVGDLFLAIGSSSAVKWCDTSSGTGFTANAAVRRYDATNNWVAAGVDGSIITVLNGLNTTLGVPVAVVQAGVSGSKLLTWSDSTSVDYTAFKSKLTAVGGKLAGVLATVGSNDAGSGVVVSQADHYAKWQTFIGNIRSDAGQSTLPFFVSGSNGRSGADDTQMNWVRQTETNLENLPNVYFGATTIDLEIDSADNIHLTANSNGFPMALFRMSLTLNDILGAGTYHRGPRINGYTYAGVSATVTVIHVGGTNLAINAAHGFIATDGSGALSISSATIATATTIAITFGRAISGSLLLKYGSGTRPIESGQGVHDNTTEALPLEVFVTPLGLFGDATDTATATGGLTAKVQFVGAAIDQVTATGSLTAGNGLNGNATAIATANGGLLTQIKLNASALAQALAAAGLTTGINLSGFASDTVLATGSITTQVTFSGNATDVATASGSFNGAPINLSGNALGQSTATGNITAQIKFTAAALAQALATGVFTTSILLVGNASDIASAVGNLTNVGVIVYGTRSSTRSKNIQKSKRPANIG